MKKIKQILGASIKTGLIMVVLGLIVSLIMRFHFLFVFVPHQVRKSGGFWNHFIGAGEYNWYLSDPVGLILFFSCSLPVIFGLIFIFGGLFFEDKIQSKMKKEFVGNYLRKMNIKKKEVGPRYKKIKKKGKTRYTKI